MHRPNAPFQPAAYPNMASGAAGVNLIDYVNKVKDDIENCITNYMNEEETKQCLLDLHGISPDVTSILWKRLEEENPEFFESYFVRLILGNQIKEFNMLLSQQAELMNQLATVDNWQAPARINSNFPSSANGQLMGFSDMASALPHSSIVLPRDGLFSNPSCSVDAFSHMRNMNIVTNNMIPLQSYNPANGFSDGGLIHQNYGSPDDSLFDFSSNGNIPQLFPLTCNDFTLPPYMDQINDDGGLYTSMLLGHTPNNTNNDVHIPMNTIDGTVPLRAFGGMRIDDNQLRTWL